MIEWILIIKLCGNKSMNYWTNQILMNIWFSVTEYSDTLDSFGDASLQKDEQINNTYHHKHQTAIYQGVDMLNRCSFHRPMCMIE